jgi:hypothetical protein
MGPASYDRPIEFPIPIRGMAPILILIPERFTTDEAPPACSFFSADADSAICPVLTIVNYIRACLDLHPKSNGHHPSGNALATITGPSYYGRVVIDGTFRVTIARNLGFSRPTTATGRVPPVLRESGPSFRWNRLNCIETHLHGPPRGVMRHVTVSICENI